METRRGSGTKAGAHAASRCFGGRCAPTHPGIRHLGAMPAAAMHRAPIITLFFIWRLHGKPRHAYSLIKDIRDVGIASCKPSTVYALLSKMEEAGLVKSRLERKGARTRRLFQATRKGTKLLLNVKANRVKGVWREFVEFLVS